MCSKPVSPLARKLVSPLARKLLVALPVLLLALSCTPKVGEAPPSPASQKSDPSGSNNLESKLSCISEIKPALKEFTEGVANDAKLASAWNCSQEAVKLFKRYVVGRSEEHFTSAEVAKFMENEFLKADGTHIPPELTEQIMHFKRLFIGGSAEKITRPELDAFIDLLGRFKTLSLQLNPSMAVLVKSWVPDRSFAKSTEQIECFEKANANLQAVAGELAAMIKENQAYEMANFVVFVQQLESFLKLEDSAISTALGRYLPVVEKAKVAVSGGSESKLSGREWANFIAATAKGYAQYLRYYYFASSLSQGSKKSLDADRADYLFRSADDILRTLHKIISLKPVASSCSGKPCLSQAELSEIFEALAKADPDFKFSDKLLSELMKIKVLYFGGRPSEFVATDLAMGIQKFQVLQKNLELLLPHYSVLTKQWQPQKQRRNDGQKTLQAARADFLQSVNEVSGLLRGDYDLNNLRELLKEYDRLHAVSSSKELQRFYPLVKDVKNTVFSDEDTVVHTEQWRPFLNLVAQGYSSYLQYHYFVQEESYGQLPFLEGLKVFADQINQFLQSVLATNKNHLLTPAQVKKLILRFSEFDVLPEGISSSALDKLIDLAIERVLWPAELRLQKNSAQGIGLASVQNVMNEFTIWYETERFFYTLGPRKLSHAQVKEEVAKKLKGTSSRFLKEGLHESSLVLAGSVSKVVDPKQRLIISRRLQLAYDTQSLSQLNLHRTMGRVLIRTAIDDLNRLKQNRGLVLAEAEHVFQSVHPTLADLALVDRANTTFIKSRFSESNVFSPHSNGDTLSNFEELTDIVGMIYSGIIINSDFKKNLAKECGLKPRVGEDAVLREACVYETYLSHTEKNMASMPEHIRVVKSISKDSWKQFFAYVLQATGHVPNSQGTILMSKLSLAPHVVQYMEMVYSKYDEDQNDVIDAAEAIKAYPAFSGLLAELTKEETLIKREELPAMFTYILHYGEPPKGLFDYFFKWRPWKKTPSQWNIAADRMRVAKIFGFIAEKTRAARKKIVAEPEELQIRNDPRFVERTGGDSQYYGL